MSKIQFETGQTVEFEGNPTQQDVEEVAKQLNIQVQQPKQKSFLRKAGEFLGEATGVLGVGEGFREAGKIAKAGLTGQPIPAPSISPRRFAGAAATAGLTAASFGGAGTVGTLGARVAKTAALGAGFGGAGALQQDKGLLGVAKSAALGAGLGAGVSAAGAGLSALARELTVKTPRQLVNFALKTPSKKAGQGTAEAFLKRRLGGKTLGTIETKTSEEITNLEGQLQKILPSVKGKLDSVKVFTDVKNAINQKTGAKLSADTLKERILKFIPDHAPILNKTNVSVEDLNIVRRAIDNNLREATFLGKELTNEQKAIKVFADRIRALVQKKSGTQSIFKTYSEAVRINQLAREALKKAETQGRPGLLDIGSAGIGGIIGGLPGAAVGVGIERLSRSAPVQGGIAQGLRSLQSLQPILKKLAPAERTIILNLLGRQAGQ